MKLEEKIAALESQQIQLGESHRRLRKKIHKLAMIFDVLNAKARKRIKPSNFVFPATKRYPIHDLAHAKNALARSSGKPEEAKVKAAVHRKYTQLKKSEK